MSSSKPTFVTEEGVLFKFPSVSEAQKAYVSALRKQDVVFCVGPAGTGKTFLAVAAALEAHQAGRVNKIVLVRPAVNAGEELGFLPGSATEKITPFLLPMLDALNALIPHRAVLDALINSGSIEMAALAFMRGRTLHNSFVILDEAQNTTPAQMKLMLTRIGQNSKIVVVGDPTQTDLEVGQVSGLYDVLPLVQKIPEVAVVKLTKNAIVRHPVVRSIVAAYEQRDLEPA